MSFLDSLPPLLLLGDELLHALHESLQEEGASESFAECDVPSSGARVTAREVPVGVEWSGSAGEKKWLFERGEQ